MRGDVRLVQNDHLIAALVEDPAYLRQPPARGLDVFRGRLVANEAPAAVLPDSDQIAEAFACLVLAIWPAHDELREEDAKARALSASPSAAVVLPFPSPV